MNEMFSVKDQVVVITGGTGVLGSCIGEYLALQGAKVVLLFYSCKQNGVFFAMKWDFLFKLV